MMGAKNLASYQYEALEVKIARPRNTSAPRMKMGMNFLRSVVTQRRADMTAQSQSIAPMLAASKSNQVNCIPSMWAVTGASSSTLEG